MGRVTWRLRDCPKNLWYVLAPMLLAERGSTHYTPHPPTQPHARSDRLLARYAYTRLCLASLLYNQHCTQSYASDVCMEPIFWCVDNYTHVLGPVFVAAVAAFTALVIFIAHWIGIPFYWQRSPTLTVCLIAIGYWLIVNIAFHYTMAVRTPPGRPPTAGEFIRSASTVCKKCIAPKPPRTHHCSVCRRCVLKMDHHCREYSY